MVWSLRFTLKISLIFILLSKTFVFCQINLITGQPELNYGLGIISSKSGMPFSINLEYKGSGQEIKSQFNNDEGTTSWCGYGWSLSVPTIYAYQNGTANMDDDKWFYKDANGNVDEIVRVYTNGTEKYFIKSEPYSKITPSYSSISPNVKVITGWEIATTAGIISRFGDGTSTPLNTAEKTTRYISCSAVLNSIGKNGVTPLPYQWDLREIEDPNKSKFTFSYIQTLSGFVVLQSYPQSIESDNGDKIVFNLLDKNVNENRKFTDALNNEFDFTETKYIDNITFLNKSDITLNEINFKYECASGQECNLNFGLQGFEKRLLRNISSSSIIGLNHQFDYDMVNGLLIKDSDLKSGRQTLYTISDKQMDKDLSTDVDLGLVTTNYNKTITINMGNFIYTIDTSNGSTTKFEIVENNGTKLQKCDIAGITNSDLTDTRIYPGNNYFVLAKANINPSNRSDTTGHDIKIYEWIDGNWVLNSTFGNTGTKSLLLTHKINVSANGSWFLIYEKKRQIIYVFNKANGNWISTFNSPYNGNNIANDYNHDSNGEGWNYPLNQASTTNAEADIRVGSNYFIYFCTDVVSNSTNMWLCVYYWDGNTWKHLSNPALKNVLNNGPNGLNENGGGDDYIYDDMFSSGEGKSMTGFALDLQNDGYFISANNTNIYDASVGGGTRVFYIRKFDFVNNILVQEGFDHSPTISTPLTTWPRSSNSNGGIRVFPHKNYVVVIEPDDWTMVYHKINGIWKPTYFAQSISGDDPSKSDASHLIGNSCIPYSKAFFRHIDTVFCADDYFVAVNKNSQRSYPGNFMWVYRWNDLSRKWDSKINGWDNITRDPDGQGIYFGTNWDIKNVFPNKTNIGIWAQHLNGQSYGEKQLSIEDFNSKENRYNDYVYSWIWNITDNADVTINDNTLIKRLQDGSNQKITVQNKCRFAWDGKPTVKIVTSVSDKDDIGNNIVTTYDYSATSDGQLFEPSQGIPFFSEVTCSKGSGAGKIKYYFNIDSTNGFFGVTNKTEYYNSANPAKLKMSSQNYWGEVNMDMGNYRTVSIPRIEKTEIIKDNVTSTVNYPLSGYNPVNGLQSVSFTNGNGNIIANKTIYAYEKYSDMLSSNMLTEQAGTNVYGIDDPSSLIKTWWSTTGAITTSSSTYYKSLDFANPNDFENNDVLSVLFQIKTNFYLPDRIGLGIRLNGSIVKMITSSISLPYYPRQIVLNYQKDASDPSVITQIELVITGINSTQEISALNAQITKSICNNNNIRSSTVNTWLGKKPHAIYKWKSDMDITGHPRNNFTQFDYNNESMNPDWKLINSSERYDPYGQVIETKKGINEYSATIYNKIGMPVAKISNCRSSECLFSDFSDKDISEIEKSGNVSLSTLDNDLHFSNKTLKLTRNGNDDQWARTSLSLNPTDGVSLGGKKIIWEFWAKADRTTSSFVTLQTESDKWLVSNYFNLSTDWQKYQFSYEIPANENDKQFRIVFRPPYVENVGYADGTTYFDDVRAYRSNALVTTTYYDPNLRDPVLTIDENNNPTLLTEYDSYHRPNKWYKLNKIKSRYDAGFKTIVKQNEYHEMGVAGTFGVIFPNGGEILSTGSMVKIAWGNNGVGDNGVDIFYTSDNGSNWTPIASQVKNQSTINWTVPNLTSNQCKIKVVDHDNSSLLDQSDAVFTIGQSGQYIPEPILQSPSNYSQINQGNPITLAWTSDAPLEGTTVTYDVYIDPLGRVATNITDKSYTANGLNIGCHEWYVVAKSGYDSKCSVKRKIMVIPSDFYYVRCLDDGILKDIPDELYSKIYVTLNTTNQSKFAQTYNTSSGGYHHFKYQTEFQNVISDGTSILMKGQVESNGWLNWVSEGAICGTTGQSKRLEAFQIKVNKATPDVTYPSLNYQSYVESLGWAGECLYYVVPDCFFNTSDGQWYCNEPTLVLQKKSDWVSFTEDKFTGTTGIGYRLEALNAQTDPGYHVWYRAHVQNNGWLDWVSGGNIAGTTGQSKRMEAFQLYLLKYEN